MAHERERAAPDQRLAWHDDDARRPARAEAGEDPEAERLQHREDGEPAGMHGLVVAHDDEADDPGRVHRHHDGVVARAVLPRAPRREGGRVAPGDDQLDQSLTDDVGEDDERERNGRTEGRLRHRPPPWRPPPPHRP